MQKLINCLLVTLIASLSYAQTSFSLDEAIEYAKENSNAKKQAQLDVLDAEAIVQEYKAIGMPTLNIDAGYSYFPLIPANPVEDFLSPAIYGILFQEEVIPQKDLGPPETFKLAFQRKQTLSAGLGFSVLLFDASYLKGLKAAKQSIDLSAKQIELTDAQIASMVTKSYLSALIADRNIEFIDKNITVIEKSLEETKIVYENGFIEQLDVDRLQLSLDNLKIEREKISELIGLSKNVLKYQMSHPLEQEITLTEDLETLLDRINVEELIAQNNADYANRPEYSILNEAIKLDEMDIDRLSKNLPSIRANAGLDGSLQRDRLLDNDESGIIPSAFLNVGLNYKIFDGKERKAQKQRSQIRKEKKQLDLEEFQRGMDLEVLNATTQVVNAKKSLDNRVRTLELSQRIFDRASIKFKEGVGSSVELNQAEAALYDAQSNYINAMYDLVIAKAELDIAHGNIK